MIFVILYQIFVVWLSYKNYYIISSGKKVKHWLNGMIHVTAAGLVFFAFRSFFLSVSLLLLTRVVFDTSLNIFRHFSLGYISGFPKSWLDKQEKKLIFWLASKVYKKRTIIGDHEIERIAVYFRLLLLITGIWLLFI